MISIWKYFALSFFSLIFFSTLTIAQPQQSWSQFVQEIRTEALAKGIRPSVFDKAFSGIHEPQRTVLHLDRTQPEKRLTFLKYRDTRADAFRIKLGRSELKRHREVLEKIGQEYGVSPCFILSLWGLETSYGRYMGNFPVVQSLATLAYDNRRASFFRQQLFYALEILNGNHVSLEKFKGEWAGASGHPQFLPSSWRDYAVDYDGDGKRDIWTSLPDVFASIANYLVKNGWQRGQPWAIPVIVPANFNEDLMTRQVTKTVEEWKNLGVSPEMGQAFPQQNLSASIIKPYGGPAFMIFNNFKVIMKWNHSIYYAATVGYMAEQICRQKL